MIEEKWLLKRLKMEAFLLAVVPGETSSVLLPPKNLIFIFRLLRVKHHSLH